MRRIIRGFPEVQTVISQLGRPDDGTDTTGFFNCEFNVPLKAAGASYRITVTSFDWRAGGGS